MWVWVAAIAAWALIVGAFLVWWATRPRHEDPKQPPFIGLDDQ